MKRLSPIVRAILLLGWLAAWTFATPAFLHAQQQQQRIARIGYLYPAGMQRGTACEITVGGQFLNGTKEILVSGSGVTATVIKINKQLSQMRLNELRNYLQEARKKITESKERPVGLLRLNSPEMTTKLLKESGATDDEIKAFFEFREKKSDPKRQPNLQIAETVTIKVEAAPNAQTGPHSLRLLTQSGVTNPLSFCISGLPELRKEGPLGKTLETAKKATFPAVLNGQILPGEVDHYTFQARRGARVVIAVQARDLIPYLADAVPGWFQPVVALYDAKGKEVAYANDFRFSPDPVLCYEAPADGAYLLEIRDALYRGREDFVYRVTVGEVPFVTGIFPLGGNVGEPATVRVWGWNLPRTRAVLNTSTEEGIHAVPELSNGFVIGNIPFASDTLSEITEEEPNNTPEEAQRVQLPVIINGRIDSPGDVDVFSIYCKAETQVVAEVIARRLGSPLDSCLKVTDIAGKQIAFNDDFDDKGSALLTHNADSYLTFTAPATGRYYIHLSDSQRKGGPEYGYRLRISQPRPDFALRIVPSCINARPGVVVPVTVYALRKDGFSGDIRLELKDAPEGFLLSGGVIPAGQDKVTATVTFPPNPLEKPVNLTVKGQATINRLSIVHPAVPADDMIQAFMYHHLVPASELLAVNMGTGGPSRGKPPFTVVGSTPMELLKDRTGKVVLSCKLRPFDVSRTHLEVSEPSEGITVEGLAAVPEGIAITFRADTTKIKPGQAGNLLIEVFNEYLAPAKDGKPAEKKSWPGGYLPAIPFKVVEH